LFIKLKRNLLIVFIFAILIYFGLIFYADFDKTISSLKSIPLDSFLLSLFVIIISISFKFIRWHIYLNELDINLTFADSLLVFTSGFVMSISPGKIGELLKSFLLKSKYQIPIAKSSPVVVAERILEFTALILLCLVGVIIYNSGSNYIFILAPILIAGAVIVNSQKFRNILRKIFARLPFIKKYIDDIEEFNLNLKKLLRLNIFLKILLISILAWILEFYGFYFILSSLKNDITLVWASFSYSLSIIIGAVSMLPGGLGTTEGTLSLLLTQNGITENLAIASTIVIRLFTLWIPVFLGFIAMIIFWMKKGNKI
jgi:uncharacterized protein (TIRG00374 family)